MKNELKNTEKLKPWKDIVYCLYNSMQMLLYNDDRIIMGAMFLFTIHSARMTAIKILIGFYGAFLICFLCLTQKVCRGTLSSTASLSAP